MGFWIVGPTVIPACPAWSRSPFGTPPAWLGALGPGLQAHGCPPAFHLSLKSTWQSLVGYPPRQEGTLALSSQVLWARPHRFGEGGRGLMKGFEGF